MTRLSSRTIDALRFPCAVLVILLHVWSVTPKPDPAAYSLFDTFFIAFSGGICRLAVPTFFFISGYLFFFKLERWDWPVWTKKLKKRAKTLLVPYLLWISLDILWYFGLSLFRHLFSGWGSPFTFMSENGWGLMYWNCARKLLYKATPNILGWAMPSTFPFDYPLWFIRDLIILCLLAPAIHFAIRKTKGWILCLLYPLFLLQIWIPLEGFSAEGFFFFSLGAWLQISGKDIVTVFSRFRFPSYLLSIIAVFLCIRTFGDDYLWGYATRFLTLPGCVAAFNIVSRLLQKGIWKNNSFLAEASFPLFAAHTIGLPLLTGLLLERLLPWQGEAVLFLRTLIKPVLIIAIILILFRWAKRYIPKTTALFTGGR